MSTSGARHTRSGRYNPLSIEQIPPSYPPAGASSSPIAQGLGGPGLGCGVGRPRVSERLPGHRRHRPPLHICCLRPPASGEQGGRVGGSVSGVRSPVRAAGAVRRRGLECTIPASAAGTRARALTDSYDGIERPYLADCGRCEALSSPGGREGRDMLAEAGRAAAALLRPGAGLWTSLGIGSCVGGPRG